MAVHPPPPAGWSVTSRHRVGPFTTAVTYQHADGRRLEWRSRQHRKRVPAGLPERSRHPALWSPRRLGWWVGVLFVVGSTCFLVGPMAWFFTLVGAELDARVFFVGSLFFTSAAALQWLESVLAGRAAEPEPRALWSSLVQPRRIDWWSTAVQLVGTVFFNASTFRALSTTVDSTAYNDLVWRPDALGSVCFLVSGYLAYVEVAGSWLGRVRRDLDSAIVGINLAGCIAFGVSAVAAYVVPGTSAQVDAEVANVATSLGALGFLTGASLMLLESAREHPVLEATAPAG